MDNGTGGTEHQFHGFAERLIPGAHVVSPRGDVLEGVLGQLLAAISSIPGVPDALTTAATAASAELELAKRSSARNAEVSVLMAAMVPGIRMAMGTYRPQNIEAIATKVSARLGSEAEKSEELISAQDVLAEMKIANKHATEAEALPQLKLALETSRW